MFMFRARLCCKTLHRAQMPWQLVQKTHVNKHVTHICHVNCSSRLEGPQEQVISRPKDSDRLEGLRHPLTARHLPVPCFHLSPLRRTAMDHYLSHMNFFQ